MTPVQYEATEKVPTYKQDSYLRFFEEWYPVLLYNDCTYSRWCLG